MKVRIKAYQVFYHQLRPAPAMGWDYTRKTLGTIEGDVDDLDHAEVVTRHQFPKATWFTVTFEEDGVFKNTWDFGGTL